MTEADYRGVTLDLALRIAETLVRTSPGMTFVHVSGAGTDETGKSRLMWARVKGEAENAHGFERAILESVDINVAAARGSKAARSVG